MTWQPRRRRDVSPRNIRVPRRGVAATRPQTSRRLLGPPLSARDGAISASHSTAPSLATNVGSTSGVTSAAPASGAPSPLNRPPPSASTAGRPRSVVSGASNRTVNVASTSRSVRVRYTAERPRSPDVRERPPGYLRRPLRQSLEGGREPAASAPSISRGWPRAAALARRRRDSTVVAADAGPRRSKRQPGAPASATSPRTRVPGAARASTL